MNIRIITDSAADFTQQELAAHHIHCVPMTITFGEEAFIDGVTLSPDTFWQRLLAGETAKTSQPSPDAFLSAFEDARAAGDAVVCVLLSSALSGTLQSAMIARSMIDYEPIYLVDSLTAAVAQKVLVLRACQLREEGRLDAAQIARELEDFRSRIRLYAALDTLVYLARGGRIPKAAASLGTLVQLKPLVTVGTDGLVEMAGKAIGLHRASEALIKLTKGHAIDPSFPVIPIYAHTPENCLSFVKKLQQAGIPCRPEDATPIGTTISTHIGPGAYGLVFVEEA